MLGPQTERGTSGLDALQPISGSESVDLFLPVPPFLSDAPWPRHRRLRFLAVEQLQAVGGGLEEKKNSDTPTSRDAAFTLPPEDVGP